MGARFGKAATVALIAAAVSNDPTILRFSRTGQSKGHWDPTAKKKRKTKTNRGNQGRRKRRK